MQLKVSQLGALLEAVPKQVIRNEKKNGTRVNLFKNVPTLQNYSTTNAKTSNNN